MPWIEAMLRGQKILARADAQGALVAEGGRVEIRYKPTDGRSYRAGKGNLAIVEGARRFPDDHCVEAGAAPSAPSKYEQDKAKKVASGERFARENTAGATTAPRGHEFIAYTDGACSGNPGPAGCGYLVVDPVTQQIREGYEFLGTSTNNVAELTAILRGVEAVADVAAHIRVHTDSSYAIGVLQKGWRAKANVELITKIRAELARRPHVRLVYVPGHAGVPLNERADELAREAVTSRRSKPIVGG